MYRNEVWQCFVCVTSKPQKGLFCNDYFLPTRMANTIKSILQFESSSTLFLQHIIPPEFNLIIRMNKRGLFLIAMGQCNK